MNIRFCLVASLLFVSSLSFAQNQNATRVGQPWTGSRGITVSVPEIKRLDSLTPQRSWRIKMKEKEGPDRSHLPLYPGSPKVSQWPPVDGQVAPHTGDKPNLGPLFSLSTSFTAITGTETNSIPPDTMGDVSPTQIMAIANGRIKVFNKATQAVVLNSDLDTFFAAVHGGEGVCDSRCRYDRLTNRWYIICISLADISNRVCLAVSSGSTITDTSSFTFFQFQHDAVTPVGDTGAFCDYPTLAVDKNALYIGGNIFGSSFDTSLYVIRKSSVTSTGPIIVTAFRNLLDGVNNIGPFTPMGVDNDDPAATEGLIVAPDGYTWGRLVMRRVSNPGGTPSLGPNIGITVPATSNTYEGVLVKGSSYPLDALDDRLFSAKIFKNAVTGARTLWIAHNVSVGTDGVATDTVSRFASRWYEFGNLTGTLSLIQSGTVYDPTATGFRSYWIPSIAMNGQGHAALGCSIGGTLDYAGAGYAFRLSGDTLGTMRAPVLSTPSSFAMDITWSGNPQRWGDYSHTVVDPADNQTMWTFQEFTSAANVYGVRVTKLLAPPPATISSLSPNNAVAGSSVTITVNGTSTKGSGFFDPGTGYPNRLSAAFSGAGITVDSVSFVNPTKVNVTATISSDAATGARNLTVTNPDGQTTTLSNGFTVNPIAAEVIIKSLTAPTSLVSGATGTATLTLTASAPTGGATIAISSNNAALTAQSSVVVPAGSTSVQFLATAKAVGATTNATLTASIGSSTANATVSVKPSPVSEVKLTPNSVFGGSVTAVTGKVTLGLAAPLGGVVVNLTSDKGGMTVPSTVIVPEGSSSKTFVFTHSPVAVVTLVKITGSTAGGSKIGKINVYPPKAKRVSFSRLSLTGGSAAIATGTVKLNAPAPAGGISVALSSDSTLVSLSSTSVTVPAGATTKTFTVTAPTSVSVKTAVHVTATLNGSAVGTINVIPPKMSYFAVAPATVIGSSTKVVKVTVSINAPAPTGGLVINLASSNTAVASVPATLTIPAGLKLASATVTHTAVATTAKVTVSATLGTVTRSAVLTVTP